MLVPIPSQNELLANIARMSAGCSGRRIRKPFPIPSRAELLANIKRLWGHGPSLSTENDALTDGEKAFLDFLVESYIARTAP